MQGLGKEAHQVKGGAELQGWSRAGEAGSGEPPEAKLEEHKAESIPLFFFFKTHTKKIKKKKKIQNKNKQK